MYDVLKKIDARVTRLRKGLARMEDARSTPARQEEFQEVVTRIDELETLRNSLQLPSKEFKLNKRSGNG